jgi:hypothetical protein
VVYLRQKRKLTMMKSWPRIKRISNRTSCLLMSVELASVRIVESTTRASRVMWAKMLRPVLVCE